MKEPVDRPESRQQPTRVRKNPIRTFGTFILLLALIALFTIVTPTFMTTSNWSDIALTQVVTACLALAATLVLIAGEFDLSLGYLVGFDAIIGGFLGEHHVGALVMVMTMLSISLAIGIINGILTVYFKISSFIATLAVGIILSGITLGLSGGQVLYQGIPQFLQTLGQGKFEGIGISVWIVLIVSAVLFYGLEYTPLGRQLYAVGGAERVAFLAGIRAGFLKIVVFAVAGLLVGVGAVFALGQSGAANPAFGSDLLLPAYAAVFLGVTTFRPGTYNVIGTIIAIMLLAVGFNGLSLLGAPYWAEPVFNGVVLLVAVLTAYNETRRVKIG